MKRINEVFKLITLGDNKFSKTISFIVLSLMLSSIAFAAILICIALGHLLQILYTFLHA